MEKIKQKIIITGNLGYVGSVLTDYLIKKNYEVVGFDLGWFKNDLVILSIDACILIFSL